MELTATDVRPYFEDQELLGRLPSSEFAPHVFDKEQELPMTLPTPSPKDDLPVTPIVAEDRGVTEPSTSFPTEPHSEPPPAETIPAEIPSEPVPAETVITKPETKEVPEVKRGRGRPPGKRNKPKVCPNCTTQVPCVIIVCHAKQDPHVNSTQQDKGVQNAPAQEHALLTPNRV